jgi:hypothetical protein
MVDPFFSNITIARKFDARRLAAAGYRPVRRPDGFMVGLLAG